MKNVNIKHVRGDDLGLKLSFKDSNDDPINITGWTLYFTLKTKIEDADDDAVISKTVTSFSDPTGGVGSVTVGHVELKDLLGSFYYDVRYKDNTDIVKTVVYGEVEFIPDRSRRAAV